MNKEKELEEMVHTGTPRKRIAVVCARQERIGVMYADKRALREPEDVLRTFESLFENMAVEQVIAVSVTRNYEPVAMQVIAIGGVSSCPVDVAEILKLALLSNCPEILLVHNHPSGNAEPSSEDKNLTERLKKACAIVGLDLIDHVIVGGHGMGYSICIQRPVDIQEKKTQKGA